MLRELPSSLVRPAGRPIDLEQRMHWVSVGKSTGLPADCDTFAAE
jgi:hypothetical protein